jgi:hypothetical protein
MPCREHWAFSWQDSPVCWDKCDRKEVLIALNWKPNMITVFASHMVIIAKLSEFGPVTRNWPLLSPPPSHLLLWGSYFWGRTLSQRIANINPYYCNHHHHCHHHQNVFAKCLIMQPALPGSVQIKPHPSFLPSLNLDWHANPFKLFMALDYTTSELQGGTTGHTGEGSKAIPLWIAFSQCMTPLWVWGLAPNWVYIPPQTV